MVKDLRLARSGIGDERLVKNVEDILADLLQLGLDLVAVLADGGDMLVGTLGLLLLLDRRDDAPTGTTGADHVLVRDRQQVALVDSELTAQLGDLLHVGDHLIVALSLLAEAGEESLAAIFTLGLVCGGGYLTSVAASKRENTPFALWCRHELLAMSLEQEHTGQQGAIRRRDRRASHIAAGGMAAESGGTRRVGRRAGTYLGGHFG